MHLPRVLSRTEQEEIGERRRVPQVQDDDLERLFVEGSLDRLRDLAGQLPFRRRRTLLLLSFGHATGLPVHRTLAEVGRLAAPPERTPHTTGVDECAPPRVEARGR